MRALVTGASRGIGRSICLRLARDALARGGEAVIVATATGRSDDLASVVAELTAMGATSTALSGNLSNQGVPGEIVCQALDFAGGLDALVHNAGYPLIGSHIDVDFNRWDRMMGVNLRALLEMANAAYGALKASAGSICATASNASYLAAPNLPGYSASKAGLVMLINELAVSWGPDGIRANAVSPGSTHSRSTERALADPQLAAQRAELIPLRRLGTGEDIAAAVSFLTGPDAGYITGVNLPVDGGMSHMAMDAFMKLGMSGRERT